jgi:hypothetical protein
MWLLGARDQTTASACAVTTLNIAKMAGLKPPDQPAGPLYEIYADDNGCEKHRKVHPYHRRIGWFHARIIRFTANRTPSHPYRKREMVY